MQKGDEVDVVVVVEIKLVWQNKITTTEKLQANSLRAHPSYNPIVAGTTCEARLPISTS